MPGDGFALQIDQDSYDFAHEAQATVAPSWRNDITMSSFEAILEYAPAKSIELIAPRPLLFANSDNDKIFPMDGNRRIIERLRKVYKMYDKPNLVDDYVSQGGHDYRPDLRVAST